MSVEPIRDTALVSQLCVQCGLCCSGVLHPSAALMQDEGDFARSIGMDVVARQKDGEVRLYASLPCSRLSGTACGIYGQRRPIVCGTYFCHLAKNLDSGAIPFDDALAKVARAQALVRDIASEMEPGATIADAFDRLDEGGPDDEAAGGGATSGVEAGVARPRHTVRGKLLVATLTMLLDRYFRPPDKAVLKRS
jgi:hypothetical protein